MPLNLRVCGGIRLNVIPGNSQEQSHQDSGGGPRNGMAAPLREFSHSSFALRTAVLATPVILLGTAFRARWTRVETDFPHYDTAARLACSTNRCATITIGPGSRER